MSKITITIEVEDGKMSIDMGGAKTQQRPAQGGARGKGRRSNEAIPPGGSTQLLPGKKGRDEGVTIGEASMNDLEWWSNKLENGLRDDPHGKYADRDGDDLRALRAEIARRTGGGEGGAPDDGFPPDYFGSPSGGGGGDDIPFAPWTLP